MPLIRFDATYDRDGSLINSAPTHLVRFLTSHPALQNLAVQILWRTDEKRRDDALYLVTRGLRPQEAFITGDRPGSPFEALKEITALFNGVITEAGELTGGEEAWQRGDMDRFLESVALIKARSAHDVSDLILMILGDRTMVERTMELALAFGGRRDHQGVQIMRAVDASDTPYHLLRIQGIASSYPLHIWLDDERLTVLYRYGETYAFYVEWGYTYPFKELELLHTGIKPAQGRTPLALVTWDGKHSLWRHIHDEQQFCGIAQIADIHLNGAEKPIRLDVVDRRVVQAQRFQIELALKPTPAMGEEKAAMYHGQPLTDRIRTLEMQRARLERELNHLKNLEHIHFLCLFEDTEPLAHFAAQYPLAQLRRFLYLVCRLPNTDAVVHLLVSKEETGRRDLPGEIGERGQIFVRDRDWHTLGINIYLPEGFELFPFVGFETAGQLLNVIDSEIDPDRMEDMSILLRPNQEGAIEKLIAPTGQMIEFTDAVQYLNAHMRTSALQALIDAIPSTLAAQFDHQFDEAMSRLSLAYEGLQQRFTRAVIDLNTDLDDALAELESRKAELDEYVRAREEISRYCHEIRLLVRNPGNVMFEFLRKETELNRDLTNRLATIDYRYNIQFEKYEQQVKDITQRNHHALQRRLGDLLQRLKHDGAAVQHLAEDIERRFKRYHNAPDRVLSNLQDLKKLNEAVQEMVEQNMKTIPPKDNT